MNEVQARLRPRIALNRIDGFFGAICVLYMLIFWRPGGIHRSHSVFAILFALSLATVWSAIRARRARLWLQYPDNLEKWLRRGFSGRQIIRHIFLLGILPGYAPILIGLIAIVDIYFGPGSGGGVGPVFELLILPLLEMLLVALVLSFADLKSAMSESYQSDGVVSGQTAVLICIPFLVFLPACALGQRLLWTAIHLVIIGCACGAGITFWLGVTEGMHVREYMLLNYVKSIVNND